MSAQRFAPLRPIRSYDPDDLARSIAQLEQNLREKFDSDNARAFGPFRPTATRAQSFLANSWDLALVDPSSGTLKVSIPSPREPTVGYIIVKNNTTNTNSIEVEPIGGKIDGFDSYSFGGAYSAILLAPNPLANEWSVLFREAGSGGP